MKRVLFLAALLASGCTSVGQDKYLHAGVSTVIGATAQAYTDDELTSAAVCMSVGLAKEIYDEYDYGGFSGGDLVADAVGCALGIYGVEAIKVMTKKDTTFIFYEHKL